MDQQRNNPDESRKATNLSSSRPMAIPAGEPSPEALAASPSAAPRAPLLRDTPEIRITTAARESSALRQSDALRESDATRELDPSRDTELETTTAPSRETDPLHATESSREDSPLTPEKSGSGSLFFGIFLLIFTVAFVGFLFFGIVNAVFSPQSDSQSEVTDFPQLDFPDSVGEPAYRPDSYEDIQNLTKGDEKAQDHERAKVDDVLRNFPYALVQSLDRDRCVPSETQESVVCPIRDRTMQFAHFYKFVPDDRTLGAVKEFQRIQSEALETHPDPGGYANAQVNPNGASDFFSSPAAETVVRIDDSTIAYGWWFSDTLSVSAEITGFASREDARQWAKEVNLIVD